MVSLWIDKPLHVVCYLVFLQDGSNPRRVPQLPCHSKDISYKYCYFIQGRSSQWLAREKSDLLALNQMALIGYFTSRSLPPPTLHKCSSLVGMHCRLIKSSSLVKNALRSSSLHLPAFFLVLSQGKCPGSHVKLCPWGIWPVVIHIT